MSKPAVPRALFLVAAVSLAGAVACGIAIKRDLSTIPQGQVGFDDMCGLQDYFDSLEAGVAHEPFVVSSLDHEGDTGKKTVRGGKARIRFEGDFQLKHLRRVLNENWRRLPEGLETANKVELEVRWAEKAGVRRVVTEEEAEIYVDQQLGDALPYHVCLSELLYGAPLYKARRVMWGLPDPLPVKRAAVKPDAGVDGPADAATPDGAAD
jgi:hypothetical protein